MAAEGARSQARSPAGQWPKSDRLAANVVALVEAEKLSYRLVAKRLNISKNTVTEIMNPHFPDAHTRW